MNASSLNDAFRSDVVDETAPYFWTEGDVVRYMADAYTMFVRLTGGISDFLSPATELNVVADQAVADISPTILRIMSATRRSDNAVVSVINSTDIGKLRSKDYGQSKAILMDNRSGPVRYMVIGMQKDKVRLIQIPEADDIIDMVIYRLPLEPVSDLTHDLAEIEEHHHLHLLDWMKHLAYRKQDADTFDPKKSAECEASFRAYCAQVKAEIERYKHKSRVVTYGGI